MQGHCGNPSSRVAWLGRHVGTDHRVSQQEPPDVGDVMWGMWSLEYREEKGSAQPPAFRPFMELLG